ncbi:MAG: endolytic transglycosylase MltG [Spirochaetia bacterium]|jgi:UPF0755 protein|nr:endolytic transglycosylase MltG [Spirochaetia bacterium]
MPIKKTKDSSDPYLGEERTRQHPAQKKTTSGKGTKEKASSNSVEKNRKVSAAKKVTKSQGQHTGSQKKISPSVAKAERIFSTKGKETSLPQKKNGEKVQAAGNRSQARKKQHTAASHGNPNATLTLFEAIERQQAQKQGKNDKKAMAAHPSVEKKSRPEKAELKQQKARLATDSDKGISHQTATLHKDAIPVLPASSVSRAKHNALDGKKREKHARHVSSLDMKLIFSILFVIIGILVIWIIGLLHNRNPLGGYVHPQAELASVVPVKAASPASLETDSKSVQVTILPGTGAAAICDMLDKQGVCDGAALLAYILSNDLSGKLVSGDYTILKGTSIEKIASLISSPSEVGLTVFPGMTIATIDANLVRRGYGNKGDFIAACNAICSRYGLSFTEGWFESGTYKVNRDKAAENLARQMFTHLLEAVSPELGGNMVQQYSLEDILIIATLIQAETQDTSQMVAIASVIYNRLAKDMPLGIDATTRYETGQWTGELSREVLDKKTPYNTRRKKGLVPSGICCPGPNALAAAFAPGEGDYLYYLHRKDGSIALAKTYAEHLENIKERDMQ